MGVKTSKRDGDPSRDLEFWRFFLRDTGSREQSKKESENFFKTRTKQREQDTAEGKTTQKLEEVCG